MSPGWAVEVLGWVVLLCFVHLALLTASFTALLLLSAIEEGLRRRGDRTEDFDALADSRFTIPVSVICAAHNEERLIEHVVRSVLAFDYPEFELIVVNDGSTDGTLAKLQETFGMSRVRVFFRRVLATIAPRGVYRSRSEPRLTVVDRPSGGKADALNCGVNFARYRYLCCIDGDTVYEQDALLRSMRHVLHDPARVIGATSHVAIASAPEATWAGSGERPIEDDVFNNFQHLDYLRSFMTSRLGWSRLNFMLCAVGPFSIWRRSTLVELGGFSSDFSCEDIEITFRVHEHERREGRSYRILSLPYTVGHTEGPDRLAHLVSQRARWQRVILETVLHYRHMFLNPRYGTVGLLGMPFYVLAEVAAPFAELLSLSTLAAAIALGAIGPRDVLLFVGFLSFGVGTLSSAALLISDLGGPEYRFRDLLRLALLAPFEIVLYRPALTWARLVGTWGFLRGDKRWNKFQRNERSAANP